MDPDTKVLDQEGGTLLGKGLYGCVFEEPLKCKTETEKTYIDFLKRYVVTGKNNRDVVSKDSNYSFRGKQSNDSYLKAFKNIVQKMINNFDNKKEDSKNTENPHISRRKK